MGFTTKELFRFAHYAWETNKDFSCAFLHVPLIYYETTVVHNDPAYIYPTTA